MQVLIIVCFVCIINGDKIFRGSWDPLTSLTPPHFCACLTQRVESLLPYAVIFLFSLVRGER